MFSPSPEPVKPAVVLVVDDSPDILAHVHGLLSASYQVKSAASARKGLQIAQADPPPDLILLDIMMPDLDGYAVCSQLKNNARTRDIPVIFLTGKADIENEEKGFALGAADYVTKPIGPSVLLARIKAQVAVQAQRRSLEGMFHDAIEYAPVIFLIADAALQIVRANAQARQHFGYSRQDLLGMHLTRLVPGSASYLQASGDPRSTAAALDTNPELPCVRADGTVFPGAATFGQLETLHGPLHTVVLVNASERRETLLQLRQTQASLRALAVANETARENERKTIAREVHDELGQVLSALRMRLSLLPLELGPEVPGLVPGVEAMKLLVDRAIKGVRNVSTALRPQALSLGLVPAIEWLCGEFQLHTGIACALVCSGAGFELDEPRALLVYRIVQESLTNAGRHAQATKIRVHIHCDASTVELRIADDGCGFEVAAVQVRESFGLLGMRERALALGGKLDIRSRPRQGTTVEVAFALAARPPESVQ